jgi:ubiquinone/menaquinone biosynthesis C-methylase UbiE
MQAAAAERMDHINRAAWRDKESVAWFVRSQGFTDAGESAALDALRAATQGKPILDLGVGAGRTVPLLRSISPNYTAVDYTPELVSACKERYPDARVSVGDARDLSAFPDASFALVVFSFNGIDSVNAADRMRVLREAYRVLMPGGYFLFSAHNQAGPGHGERFSLGVYLTRNPIKLLARVAHALKTSGRTLYNYLRYSKLNYHGDGYSIMNASAHNHGIVIHYITLQKQLDQLKLAGFMPEPRIFENVTGHEIKPDADTHEIWWFHFVTQKPPAEAK